MHLQTLTELKKEVRLLLDYAVPDEQRSAALELLAAHADDVIGLNLLQAFYGALPEGQDDAVVKIRLLFRRQGTFLLCASSLLGNYLYMVTSEQGVLVGILEEGVDDPELLAFLGLADRAAFIRKYGEAAALPQYVPVHLDQELCPVCMVASGETHVFGCPVEVCPWCGGQLTRCNCRFEQIDRKVLERESQVDALLARINEKGRIPFDPKEQRPAYLTAAD